MPFRYGGNSVIAVLLPLAAIQALSWVDALRSRACRIVMMVTCHYMMGHPSDTLLQDNNLLLNLPRRQIGTFLKRVRTLFTSRRSTLHVPAQRPRLTRRQHQQLASRITGRDLEILRSVRRFRVLTVHQIALLHFDTEASARQRLTILSRLGALDRFRPQVPLGTGTAPFHYVLGPGGATVLAAADETDIAEYRRDRSYAVAFHRQLPRIIAVNDIAARLHYLSRHRADARLMRWLTHEECTKNWKEHVEPHAYGKWTEGDETSDFFLEYDPGIRRIDEIDRKLNGYEVLANASDLTTPVLILTGESNREVELRRHLTRRTPHAKVPIVTGCLGLFQSEEGVAAAIWLPLHTRTSRLRLAHLRKSLGIALESECDNPTNSASDVQEQPAAGLLSDRHRAKG